MYYPMFMSLARLLFILSQPKVIKAIGPAEVQLSHTDSSHGRHPHMSSVPYYHNASRFSLHLKSGKQMRPRKPPVTTTRDHQSTKSVPTVDGLHLRRKIMETWVFEKNEKSRGIHPKIIAEDVHETEIECAIML